MRSFSGSEDRRETVVNHQSLNMKVSHTLICCLFLLSSEPEPGLWTSPLTQKDGISLSGQKRELQRTKPLPVDTWASALQDGNTGLVNAQLPLYSGTEGENVTVQCYFSSSGTRKYFCKEECEPDNILVETTNDTAQRGRYSIRYSPGSPSGGFLSVTITQLNKSDSGRYMCGLDGSLLLSKEFEVIVVDARLVRNEDKPLYTRTGGHVTVECSFASSGTVKFFCKGECGGKGVLIGTDGYAAQRGRYSIRYSTRSLFVSITQLTKSDSGRYRCSLGTYTSQSHRDFEIISDASTPAPPTTTQRISGTVLYMCRTVVIVVLLLSLTLLIICIKRKTTPPHPPTPTVWRPEEAQTAQTWSLPTMRTDLQSPHEETPPTRASDQAPGIRTEPHSQHTWSFMNPEPGFVTVPQGRLCSAPEDSAT
ncbi:polymeric immunoglobulin receptor-like [Trachinotus anak]|uniref:polymeric immunoglobulin receptor-like n=1 Tax=Trachinotus anak TaxID=443729 RepID=UPI0039F1A4A5